MWLTWLIIAAIPAVVLVLMWLDGNKEAVLGILTVLIMLAMLFGLVLVIVSAYSGVPLWHWHELWSS